MSTLALRLSELPAVAQFQALGRLHKLPLSPSHVRCACGALEPFDSLSCGQCGADVSELAPVAVVLA